MNYRRLSLTAIGPALGLAVLFPAGLHAQDRNATELLRRAQTFAAGTTRWRAKVLETSQLSGEGMNMTSEIRIDIAAEAPLKLKRENSGADRTVIVCDGQQFFYSGDGHSYTRTSQAAAPQCNGPLSSFLNLTGAPTAASVIGHDHVKLADGDHACDVVRAAWTRAGEHVTRTLCIEVASGLILRDVSEIGRAGLRSLVTTLFLSFEKNPVFAPNTFSFAIPPGAAEAKPPI